MWGVAKKAEGLGLVSGMAWKDTDVYPRYQVTAPGGGLQPPSSIVPCKLVYIFLEDHSFYHVLKNVVTTNSKQTPCCVFVASQQVSGNLALARVDGGKPSFTSFLGGKHVPWQDSV